jgi:hypothetical protein
MSSIKPATWPIVQTPNSLSPFSYTFLPLNNINQKYFTSPVVGKRETSEKWAKNEKRKTRSETENRKPRKRKTSREREAKTEKQKAEVKNEMRKMRSEKREMR